MAKSGYGTLLARRETARISADMESKARATVFRVTDPPRVSPFPKGPNRPLLNTAVMIMAIGGGLACAFLFSQIRPTFNDERRLREVSGLRVLGTIVMTQSDEHRLRRRRGFVALFLSVMSLVSVYIAIMASLMMTMARA
jgi:hypothetical protein